MSVICALAIGRMLALCTCMSHIIQSARQCLCGGPARKIILQGASACMSACFLTAKDGFAMCLLDSSGFLMQGTKNILGNAPRLIRTKNAFHALLQDCLLYWRPARKSFKSIALSHRRIFAQNISTGFRSGDLGGTCHSSTLCLACAALLAEVVRNDSLSHMTSHGPRLRPDASMHAAFNSPLSTASAHSVVSALRH